MTSKPASGCGRIGADMDSNQANQVAAVTTGCRGKRATTISWHIILAVLPWSVFLPPLIFPFRFIWFGDMLTGVAEFCCIDYRLAAFLFFSLIWIICRIGNARLSGLRFINVIIFVSVLTIVEMGIAFFVLMFAIIAALPDWGRHL